MEGTVVAIKIDRRYGFIRPAGGGGRRPDDVFFHELDLAPGLVLDDQLRERRVLFDEERTHRGPRATNIRPAD